MPDVFEFQADTGKGVIVLAFLAAAVYFLVFTTSPTAALIGTVVIGVLLVVIYYVGVRADAWARGGR